MIFLLYLYENHTVMILEAEIVEEEVIKVIAEICNELDIDAEIHQDFIPGNVIKSVILLSFISAIADALHINIPNNCYIFCDKDQNQLSIKETVAKIIYVFKNSKQESNVG